MKDRDAGKRKDRGISKRFMYVVGEAIESEKTQRREIEREDQLHFNPKRGKKKKKRGTRKI